MKNSPWMWVFGLLVGSAFGVSCFLAPPSSDYYSYVDVQAAGQGAVGKTVTLNLYRVAMTPEQLDAAVCPDSGEYGSFDFVTLQYDSTQAQQIRRMPTGPASCDSNSKAKRVRFQLLGFGPMGRPVGKLLSVRGS